MKIAKNILQIVAGLIALVIAGYTVYKIIKLLFASLNSINPTVSASIIAALAAVIMGLVTQYQLKKRQLDEAHREKKIQIYEGFIKMAAEHLSQENKNLTHKKVKEQELVDFVFQFKTDLIMRGSADVIKAIARFESISSKGGDVLEAVDDIYRAMRKDVGLSNFGLRNKEIVAVYLKSTDRDKLLH